MTTSNNVILRAIEPDDIDLLYNVENDRTLWQLGNTNEPYSKELLRNYILSTTGDIYADKQLRLIIELETNEPEAQAGFVATKTNLAEAETDLTEAKLVATKTNLAQAGFVATKTNSAEAETDLTEAKLVATKTNSAQAGFVATKTNSAEAKIDLAEAKLVATKTNLAETKPDSGRSIIGIVDLTRFDPRNARAEIGIVILDRFRHRGYASQVLQRLSEYCKNLLHLHQLYAVIPATNTASLRLFDKCGYARCATLRDWLHDSSGYEQALVVQKFL